MLERPVLRGSQCLRHRLVPRCITTIPVRFSRSVSFSNRPTSHQRLSIPYTRSLHGSASRKIGVIPDTGDGEKTTPEPQRNLREAELSDEEYHELSDEYIEDLLGKLEIMAEDKSDMDVEFSAGVLNIEFPPAGTYVINKQPPNKQLWLSSPTSGPKRFNWVLDGDSMQQKEGTSTGAWVYLKDGTTLSGLLKEELGVDVDDNSSGPE